MSECGINYVARIKDAVSGAQSYIALSCDRKENHKGKHSTKIVHDGRAWSRDDTLKYGRGAIKQKINFELDYSGTASVEEKQIWPSGLSETLEPEHLNTLVRIVGELKEILKKTGHSNRDTQALRRLVDEIEIVIDWSRVKK